jgi:hypothetical protein
MAEDKSIEQQKKEFSNELQDVNAKLKPGFQKLINSLEEASPQIAKITADFRESSKDTFKGALATSKLKNLSGIVDKYMSGAEVSAEEMAKLQKEFTVEVDGVQKGFNFTGMRIAQQSFNKTQETVNKIEKAKQAAYLKQTQDIREEFRKQEKAYEAGTINAVQFAEARATFEEKNNEAQNKVNDKYDAGLEFERKKLEERQTKLQAFTDDYKEGLERATDNAGLQKFSDGIDELFGIDILGFADSMTKKVNAIGDVMGSIGGALGEAGKGLKDKVGGFMGGVKDFFTPKAKEGGKDEGVIGGAIKGKAAGMAKGMSDKAADKGVGLPKGSSKSGGFLGSIANGVKKFGDSKVLKGALTLGILGGTVGLLAIGLQQFTGLDFKTMLKGFVALGALILFARLIGKATFGILRGALAIGVLGAALIPFAFALNLMKDAGLGTILTIAAGLTVLGVAAAILGGMLPLMIMGSIAIGALGAALIPFAYAAEMAAGAFGMFINDIVKISLVDGANLILVGLGLAAIGAGLVAMTGGNLIGSLLEGIGSLFGAKSPMEKVTDFAKGLQDVDMTKITQLGVAFEKLQSAEGAIKLFSDVDAKAKGLRRFAESIDELTEALVRLESGVPKEDSWWDKMTSFAGKLMGTTEEERLAEQAQKSQQRLNNGISMGQEYYSNEELDEMTSGGTVPMRQPSGMSMEMAEVKAELQGQRQAEEIRLSRLQEMMLEHNIVARQKFGIPHLYSPEEIAAAGVQDQGGQIANARQEVSATATAGNQIAMASNQNIVNNGRTYNNLNKPQTNNDDYAVYKFGGAMGISEDDF